MNANHRCCYTSRHVGYKYRNTASNTGEYTQKRSSKDDDLLHKKIKEITEAINEKLDEQLTITKRSRQDIKNQIEKLNTKIDSVLMLNKTVLSLRDDLRKVGVTVEDMTVRLDKLDEITGWNSVFSMTQPKRKSYNNVVDIN